MRPRGARGRGGGEEEEEEWAGARGDAGEAVTQVPKRLGGAAEEGDGCARERGEQAIDGEGRRGAGGQGSANEGKKRR